MDATHTPEVWRPVREFTDLYEVSNLGRVRSRRTGSVMKPWMPRDGYPVVRLQRGGVRLTKRVHRLVADEFCEKKDDGTTLFVCHNDGSRNNNQASNLRWDTPLENNRDIGRHAEARGEPHPYGRGFRASHCIHGHEFTPENTYVKRNGSRECATCSKARANAWWRHRHIRCA